MPAPIEPLIIDQTVEDAFTYFDLHPPPLRTIMAGEAVVVVDMKDLIGEKTATYELPVLIHPPRSLPLSGTER
jgi:hypothetical protein